MGAITTGTANAVCWLLSVRVTIAGLFKAPMVDPVFVTVTWVELTYATVTTLSEPLPVPTTVALRPTLEKPVPVNVSVPIKFAGIAAGETDVIIGPAMVSAFAKALLGFAGAPGTVTVTL